MQVLLGFSRIERIEPGLADKGLGQHADPLTVNGFPALIDDGGVTAHPGAGAPVHRREDHPVEMEIYVKVHPGARLGRVGGQSL